MEKKSHIVFEVIKDDRTYMFHIPNGAPYGETYDALYTMLQEVLKLAKQALDSSKKVDETEGT